MIEIIMRLADAVRRAEFVTEPMMQRLEALASRFVEEHDLLWVDFLAMSTILDEARAKMGEAA